ncbi:hypothetical protein ACFMPD_03520 [Sedimentitalea sp. HM32M-2]|uniref:hypothetical protein n=1 Tax=Sedimentitalea sp. HM32M-2 TaxID=3351566 RepID=UPI00363B4F6C
MATDPNAPKARQKVVVFNRLKLTGNKNIKCLSDQMPTYLDKGTIGQIFKVVPNKYIDVALHWYDKRKFDLSLRVSTGVWGEFFRRK